MTVLYNMATDVNPLKYVEKRGKYMGIYLSLNVSGQTDRQVVTRIALYKI